MPRAPRDWAGAGALWITAAGWAGALRRLGAATTVLTPVGTLTEQECLANTSSAALSSRGSRSRVPASLRVIARDAQRARSMRGYDRAAVHLLGATDGIDLVWQHHELFHTAGAAVADHFDAPRIEYVHAPIVWEARRWGVARRVSGPVLVRAGELPALRSADLVACVTDEVVAEVERLGVDRDRIIVSPMGIDPERFDPAAVAEVELSRFDDLGDFIVGWVGSMRRFHSIDLALDAVRAARRQGHRIGLVIAGDGQDRQRIESLVQEMELTDAVRLLGQISNDAVPALLASVDAAVITAGAQQQFHYSPLKLREYLAMARPVAVPATGEITRLLDHGHTAMLYEPGDSAGLADVFVQLASDPALREQVGSAGRELVMRTATWDILVAEALDRLGLAGAPT